MRAAFHTLGCKVNQCDTQAMMESFLRAGHEIVSFDAEADCYIINTCTVTAMSDRKSRQMVARAHAKNPSAVIVVAGCLAQSDAEAALALPGVQLVIGNAERGRIVELVEQTRQEESTLNAVMPFEASCAFEELPIHAEERTRAMLKIQEGCNRYCSYCIIPYARGPLRSRSLLDIVRETTRLTRQGFCEFVLTGIHLSSYSGEGGAKLQDVILAMSKIEGVRRIRLGSLEPASITREFVDFAAKTPTLCRQFHVSMQSGSTTVLQRMNRRYTAQQYAENVDYLRKTIPGVALTTDVIVGFPGETEEEFAESLAFVEAQAFSRIHVFPFSPRKGTPAAMMKDQCSKEIKSRRAGQMIALGETLSLQYRRALLGSVQEVLFEKQTPHGAQGWTDTYVQVHVEQDIPANTLHTVRLLALDNEGMRGELCSMENL